MYYPVIPVIAGPNVTHKDGISSGGRDLVMKHQVTHINFINASTAAATPARPCQATTTTIRTFPGTNVLLIIKLTATATY